MSQYNTEDEHRILIKAQLREQLQRQRIKNILLNKFESIKTAIVEENYNLMVAKLIEFINCCTNDYQKAEIINNIEFLRNDYTTDNGLISRGTDGLTARGKCPKIIMNSDYFDSIIDNPGMEDVGNIQESEIEKLLSNKDKKTSISATDNSGQNLKYDYNCGLKHPLTQYNITEQYILSQGIDMCREKFENSLILSNDDNKKCIDRMKENSSIHCVINEETEQASYIGKLVDEYPNSEQDIIKFFTKEKSLAIQSSIFIRLAKKRLKFCKELIYKLRTDKLVDSNELKNALKTYSYHNEDLKSILHNYTAETEEEKRVKEALLYFIKP